MDHLESYSLLFTDALFANTVFYGGSEMAFYIMNAFGGYHNITMLWAATTGYAVSVLINYWFGRMLHKIYTSSIDSKNASANYQSLKKGIGKHGIWLLCFNMIPAIGPFLPMVTGFVNFGLRRTLLAAVISRIIYYSLILWIL